MNKLYSNHYIIVDEQNRITFGWSDGPRQEKDTTNTEGVMSYNKLIPYHFYKQIIL